jgi:hypothetical protein
MSFKGHNYYATTHLFGLCEIKPKQTTPTKKPILNSSQTKMNIHDNNKPSLFVSVGLGQIKFRQIQQQNNRTKTIIHKQMLC